MSWFEKLMPSRIRTESTNKKGSVPEGLWTKCNSCNAVLYRAELECNQVKNIKIGFHRRKKQLKRMMC